jgi:hypothetical protein
MPLKKDNPIGILFIAAPFIIGGILMLFQKGPSLVIAAPAHHAMSTATVEASETMIHAGGMLGVAVGGIIVGMYFRVR